MSSGQNSFESFLSDFDHTIDEAAAGLLRLPVSSDLTPGRWNKKQILGHLIDSASNNHQRFVRAQFTNDLNFPGYEQDNWVDAQQYANESWENLVELWSSFNRHLVHMLSAIPSDKLTLRRSKHNLDKLAFKPVPQTEPATLEYFVRDYVDHLRHHLAQIFQDETVH